MGDRCSDGEAESRAFLDDEKCNEVSLSAQFQTEVTPALAKKPNKVYAVYSLILLTSIYMVNQLDKFSLAVVAKPIAQELHYGNQECIVNKGYHTAENLTSDQLNEWKKLCNE